jgi:Ca2+-binding RTX toxin-like protein
MVTLNAIANSDNSLILDDPNQERSLIQQVPNIVGSDSPDILFGTDQDDVISALGGDDTIIGTTGNDFINGGDGLDTVDYADFGEAVTILPAGAFDNGGQTQLASIEKIIGATGQNNTIDGSTVTSGTTSIDVDLSQDSLIVENIPTIGSLNFSVENFVKVVGTSNNDSIVGDQSNNDLRGRAGDDEITGGGSNDILVGNRGIDRLNGTDSLLRGANEQDLINRRGSRRSLYFRRYRRLFLYPRRRQ